MRHMPSAPNPIRIASAMVSAPVEAAGAGERIGSQMPLTQFSEAHSAGVVQLPPFGTGVIVGVLDGVAVLVTVGVLLGEPVGVAVGVAVGVFVWHIPPMQDASGLKVPLSVS